MARKTPARLITEAQEIIERLLRDGQTAEITHSLTEADRHLQRAFMLAAYGEE